MLPRRIYLQKMEQPNELLRYADLEDKCYGVAGMTIAMFIFNAESYLAGISIDRSDLESLEFNPEFQFFRTQEISAKSMWNYILKRFNLTSGLLISNLLCRYYFHHRRNIPAEVSKELLRRLAEEGKSSCELEAEEVENVFNKNMSYLNQAFRSPNVEYVVRTLVARLQSDHHLAIDEIIELM